jgi:hypothetical protein
MEGLQVHEKSILLPLMPLSLLATAEPLLLAWLPAVATFSMYPLLKKDGLLLCYIALLLLWSSLPHDTPEGAAIHEGEVEARPKPSHQYIVYPPLKYRTTSISGPKKAQKPSRLDTSSR